MDKEFWLQKWERNEIGFHQPAGNRFLPRCWPTLGVGAEAAVLVPLCGKSVDMMWLRRQGHRVVGVELSERAVRDFYVEQGLKPAVDRVGPFARWQADGIAILQGDLFALTPGLVPGLNALYDRAALIALPQADRRRYAEVLARVLTPDARGLLVTLDYQPAPETAPPFSVPPDEVEELFRGRFGVQQLVREDVLANNPNLAARGLRTLHEAAYALLPPA